MIDAAYQPKGLMEAVEYFANPDVCHEYMKAIKWPDGVIACPQCGGGAIGEVRSRRVFQCKKVGCRKQFSVKVDTIFEDSPLSLQKWFVAVWSITGAKNGISSCELARAIRVTQKTAWFMLHRVRLAMQTGSFRKFTGEVEADETFIGGKARNMHASKRERRITGTGGKDKTAVMGILERGGKVVVKVVEDRKKATLQPEIYKHVQAGSALYTDALMSYTGLSADYIHGVIDHAVAYVNGRIHTNGLENFWSLFKRCINGTYVSVEPFHLFRYLDEQSFRFNNRKMTDGERFIEVMQQVVDRRVTWADLTGKAELISAVA